jgi:BirA family biotin operon repressor/biotin-[acetyl-CoA-carboxylase] ligase
LIKKLSTNERYYSMRFDPNQGKEDDISPLSIHNGLRTHFMGQNILYYPCISSTMSVAKEVAEGGAAEGTIVIAEEQTAGRGRLGRRWLSPKGSSILLSIILRPDVERLAQLNMVASVAVVRSIEKTTNLKPAIKWPNDILIHGKKVSGILIENLVEGGKVKVTIVGIGINVELDPSLFVDISSQVTSLHIESARKISRREILLQLLGEFERLYHELPQDKPIYEVWLSYMETLGKFIQVNWGDKIEQGYVESINADGSLTLRRNDGNILTLVAGEVTLAVDTGRNSMIV